MDKITVEQILENKEAINQLSDKKDTARKQKDDESIRLKYDVYQPKIRELEREQDEAITKVQREQDGLIAELDKSISNYYEVIGKAKRILGFLKLGNPKDLTIPDNDIELSRYTEQYQEALGYFYDSDYLKVKAFIIGNRKPKNKYSLVLVGKSIFPEELIKYPYSYGIDINNWGRYFALQQVIKESASIDDLKAYYSKRKDAILKDTIDQYERVKTEYEEVKQTYTIEDFISLIVWQCPKCNNFQTIFDSFANGYTPQCYKHDPYIDMVKVESKVKT